MSDFNIGDRVKYVGGGPWETIDLMHSNGTVMRVIGENDSLEVYWGDYGTYTVYAANVELISSAEDNGYPGESNILGIARSLVYGDRGNEYGHPLDDFSRTAKMWSGIFGVDVTPEQFALAMICVKISRLLTTPDHIDSVVDIAGYAETYSMVMEERERRDGI